MKIKLTPHESEVYFHNALCNAIGTGYMDGYGLEIIHNEETYNKAKQNLINDGMTNPCVEDIWMQILRDGNELEIADYETDDEEYNVKITLKDVHERVQTMPINHLINYIEENDDAGTADVLLQTVFFKEIIFG